jgi:hypothetical protein
MTVYPQAIDEKKCSKCGEVKLVNLFHCSSKSKDGYKPHCKLCSKIAAKQYNSNLNFDQRRRKSLKCKEWRNKAIKANPNFYIEDYQKYKEKKKERARKYYRDNKEYCLLKYKERRAQNLDLYLQISNNWKLKNKDRCRSKHRQWLKNNADKVRNYNRKRRALKKGALIQSFTDNELVQRMSVFGFRCAYCGGKFEHIDHVISLKRGGKHCLANLRPACTFCNLSKHDKELNSWFRSRK